jgi:hypothetical protein
MSAVIASRETSFLRRLWRTYVAGPKRAGA